MCNAVVKWKAPRSGCPSKQRRHSAPFQASSSPSQEQRERKGERMGQTKRTPKGKRTTPRPPMTSNAIDSILRLDRCWDWESRKTKSRTTFFLSTWVPLTAFLRFWALPSWLDVPGVSGSCLNAWSCFYWQGAYERLKQQSLPGWGNDWSWRV